MEQIIFDRAALLSALKWVYNGLPANEPVEPEIQILQDSQESGELSIIGCCYDFQKHTSIKPISSNLSSDITFPVSTIKKLLFWVQSNNKSGATVFNINFETGKVKISGDNSAIFEIPFRSDQNYTALTKKDEDMEYKYDSMGTLDIPLLIKMSKICSNDELRPVITGVYIDKNHYVSTDGHRLICTNRVGNTEHDDVSMSIIIPKKIIMLINSTAKGGEFFACENGYSYIKINRETIFFKPITERFPNHEAVIPTISDSDNKITFNIDKLIQSLKQISIGLPTTNAILMANKDESIKILSCDNVNDSLLNIPVEESQIKNRNGSIRIGYNAILLLELLTIIKSINGADAITFNYQMESRATVFSGEKIPTSIIMPIILDKSDLDILTQEL